MNLPRPAIADAILRQTAACGAQKSISPSEVAQALAPDGDGWRPLLSTVRAVAIELAREGRIEVLRKGKPADPTQDIRGVIRLRIRPPT